MENEELRSWNYVDVRQAADFIKHHLGYSDSFIEDLHIEFDENGHIELGSLVRKGFYSYELDRLDKIYKEIPAGNWVYDILNKLGYYKTNLNHWTPKFYEDGTLYTEDLMGIIGPEGVSILHERLQALGYEPAEKSLEEVASSKIEYFRDFQDFTVLNYNMRALIESDSYNKDAPPQSTFVIEECSELVTELMKLLKLLCKEERKKANREEIFGEACDVIATIMMFIVKNGYPTHDVFTYISGKYRRAVERYAEKKEL